MTNPLLFVPCSVTSFLCTIFYIILLLCILNALHLIIYLNVRHKDELPNLIVWPGLELTLTTMGLVGWTTACTSIIARKLLSDHPKP